MTAPWMPPLPHHPEPRIMRWAWTELEEAAIRKAQADAARAALEQAAKVVEPSNADRPDDWTEYARTRAECADAIRALAKGVT